MPLVAVAVSMSSSMQMTSATVQSEVVRMIPLLMNAIALQIFFTIETRSDTTNLVIKRTERMKRESHYGYISLLTA